jgi:hypothetical protein
MRIHRYFFLLLAFVLLFTQQVGSAHAVHHALEDLTQQQKETQAPHSGSCEKCADYAHFGSAFTVGAYDFTPLALSDETVQCCTIPFRSTHTLPAVARGPPQSRKIA